MRRGKAIGIGLLAGVVGVLGALTLGCGEDDAVAKLQAANEALAEAREDVEQARQAVEERREGVTQAEAELAEAEGELRAAKERLTEAETQVDVRATDAALFRTVQTRLLEDDELEDVAIAARVERGVTFLYGTVPSQELHDRAVAIARKTPGVASVESRIEVHVDVATE